MLRFSLWLFRGAQATENGLPVEDSPAENDLEQGVLPAGYPALPATEEQCARAHRLAGGAFAESMKVHMDAARGACADAAF